MMQENPPLPEQQALLEERRLQALEAAPIRKVKVIEEEHIVLGEEKVESVLVEAPKLE